MGGVERNIMFSFYVVFRESYNKSISPDRAVKSALSRPAPLPAHRPPRPYLRRGIARGFCLQPAPTLQAAGFNHGAKRDLGPAQTVRPVISKARRAAHANIPVPLEDFDWE